MEDPTNKDTKYLRNLIRARLGSSGPCSEPGQTPQGSCGGETKQESRASGDDSQSCQAKSQTSVGAQQRIFTDTGRDCEPSLDQQLAPTGQVLPNGSQASRKLAGKESQAGIMADILLLSAVCSEAKNRVQHGVDQLLEEVTRPFWDRTTGLDDGLDQQPNRSDQRHLVSFREAKGSNSAPEQAADVGTLMTKGQSACTMDCIIYLRPFQGKSRSVCIRALAQLLQVCFH